MDKIIVITGGTSGIGEELNKLFIQNGEKVITISRRIVDGNVCHYSCDVKNFNNLANVFKDIINRFGRIDILVNNAGYGLSGVTELLNIDDVKNQMDVNFMGVFNATKIALQYMQKGGKIINISSAMALFPLPFRAIYGASKSAILNLSYSMNMELRPCGIDVVAICPGDVKTNFTQNREKHFETNDRYGKSIVNATKTIDNKENDRMSASFVAEKIFKITYKKRPKPMYIIGGKYKFLYFLSNITPKSWLINLTGKLYDGRAYEKK